MTRAKQKIRDARIAFEIPTGAELTRRLDGVLQTLYLLFNEGYKASGGEHLIRAELCHEAIRLTALVAEHPAGNQPRSHALLALMLLNGAHYSMPVTETPLLDSVEIWTLVNLTDDAHPIHLHLVRFQILDRRRFDGAPDHDDLIVRQRSADRIGGARQHCLDAQAEQRDPKRFRRPIVKSRVLRVVLERSIAFVVIEGRGLPFVRFRRAVRLRLAVERAEEILLDRPLDVVGDEQIQLAVTIGVQTSTGGQLAETVQSLAETIRQRVTLAARAKALAGEGIVSATILSILPILTGVAVSFIQPGYLTPLLDDPRGRRLFVGGVCALFAGILTMRHMIGSVVKE